MRTARVGVALATVFGLALTGTLPARAEVEQGRFSAGGYFRIMTRPDFQGGDSRLGYWNLYGRLLNEGPWAALEMKLALMQPEDPGDAWTAVHAKIEGGSVANTDPLRGHLDNFALTQLYVLAGNLGMRNVTWQLGTLDSYFGDLALYDFKPTQIFYETVGVSGRYRTDHVEVLLGMGDSGYFLRGTEYNTVLTAGGTVRLRMLKNHLELGAGGQGMFEPAVQGNPNAPHATPGVDYEDYARGEVVMRFLENNPGQEDFFTRPEPVSSQSWKAVGYLGFGRLGPLKWNNFYVNYQRVHPETYVTETYDDRDYQIFVHDLTDERYQVNVGNEMFLQLVPGRLDAVWGALYGTWWDEDNEIVPTDYEQTFYSTVLRLQYYMTLRMHVLAESSVAREISHNGNRYREHADSIFNNTGGVADARGLELGDASVRNTWQGKLGVVLNPLGAGVFSRPSLRFLYGTQYSSQNNAFGNSFVENVDEYNHFGNKERHWHHVFAVEAEAWF